MAQLTWRRREAQGLTLLGNGKTPRAVADAVGMAIKTADLLLRCGGGGTPGRRPRGSGCVSALISSEGSCSGDSEHPVWPRRTSRICPCRWIPRFLLRRGYPLNRTDHGL